MVHQAAGTLSGGERARLVLAGIVWQRPNLLLLDEPTNHLDLPTREALSVALNEFEGTVMLVSHDRALLREVCDEFWLVAGGRVVSFDGDLDDYQRWLLERARGDAPRPAEARAAAAGTPRANAPAAAPPPAPPAPRDERKARAQARSRLSDLTRPLRIEIGRIDERLRRLAQERSQVEAALSAGALAPAAIADHGRRLNHIAAEVQMLEERWLDLQDQVEAATRSAAA
jgi:ATP-binding cassette subfamily F protein 3